jgi:hypothetical protein
MNQQAFGTGRLYEPNEQVPQTGLYELLHESGSGGTLVLIRDARFPACPECGDRVRFRLVKAAPHISEDKDFQ